MVGKDFESLLLAATLTKCGKWGKKDEYWKTMHDTLCQNGT